MNRYDIVRSRSFVAMSGRGSHPTPAVALHQTPVNLLISSAPQSTLASVLASERETLKDVSIARSQSVIYTTPVRCHSSLFKEYKKSATPTHGFGKDYKRLSSIAPPLRKQVMKTTVDAYMSQINTVMENGHYNEAQRIVEELMDVLTVNVDKYKAKIRMVQDCARGRVNREEGGLKLPSSESGLEEISQIIDIDAEGAASFPSEASSDLPVIELDLAEHSALWAWRVVHLYSLSPQQWWVCIHAHLKSGSLNTAMALVDTMHTLAQCPYKNPLQLQDARRALGFSRPPDQDLWGNPVLEEAHWRLAFSRMGDGSAAEGVYGGEGGTDWLELEEYFYDHFAQYTQTHAVHNAEARVRNAELAKQAAAGVLQPHIPARAHATLYYICAQSAQQGCLEYALWALHELFPFPVAAKPDMKLVSYIAHHAVRCGEIEVATSLLRTLLERQQPVPFDFPFNAVLDAYSASNNHAQATALMADILWLHHCYVLQHLEARGDALMPLQQHQLQAMRGKSRDDVLLEYQYTPYISTQNTTELAANSYVLSPSPYLSTDTLNSWLRALAVCGESDAALGVLDRVLRSAATLAEIESAATAVLPPTPRHTSSSARASPGSATTAAATPPSGSCALAVVATHIAPNADSFSLAMLACQKQSQWLQMLALLYTLDAGVGRVIPADALGLSELTLCAMNASAFARVADGAMSTEAVRVLMEFYQHRGRVLISAATPTAPVPEDPLTLLPSAMYRDPSRLMIPRVLNVSKNAYVFSLCVEACYHAQLPTLATSLLLQQKECLMLEKAIRIRKALESRFVHTMEEAFAAGGRAACSRRDTVTRNLGFSSLVGRLEEALDRKLREPVLKLAPAGMLSSALETSMATHRMRRNSRLEACTRADALHMTTDTWTNELKHLAVNVSSHQPTHFDHVMANPSGAGLSLRPAQNPGNDASVLNDPYLTTLPAHSDFDIRVNNERFNARLLKQAKERDINSRHIPSTVWREAEEAGQAKLWNDYRRDQEMQVITAHVRDQGLPYAVDSLRRVSLMRPLFAVRYGTMSALSAQSPLLRNSTISANKLANKLERLQRGLRTSTTTSAHQRQCKEGSETGTRGTEGAQEAGASAYTVAVEFDALEAIDSLPEFSFWHQCLQQCDEDEQSIMNISAYALSYGLMAKGERATMSPRAVSASAPATDNAGFTSGDASAADTPPTRQYSKTTSDVSILGSILAQEQQQLSLDENTFRRLVQHAYSDNTQTPKDVSAASAPTAAECDQLVARALASDEYHTLLREREAQLDQQQQCQTRTPAPDTHSDPSVTVLETAPAESTSLEAAQYVHLDHYDTGARKETHLRTEAIITLVRNQPPRTAPPRASSGHHGAGKVSLTPRIVRSDAANTFALAPDEDALGAEEPEWEEAELAAALVAARPADDDDVFKHIITEGAVPLTSWTAQDPTKTVAVASVAPTTPNGSKRPHTAPHLRVDSPFNKRTHAFNPILTGHASVDGRTQQRPQMGITYAELQASLLEREQQRRANSPRKQQRLPAAAIDRVLDLEAQSSVSPFVHPTHAANVLRDKVGRLRSVNPRTLRWISDALARRHTFSATLSSFDASEVLADGLMVHSVRHAMAATLTHPLLVDYALSMAVLHRTLLSTPRAIKHFHALAHTTKSSGSLGLHTLPQMDPSLLMRNPDLRGHPVARVYPPHIAELFDKAFLSITYCVIRAAVRMRQFGLARRLLQDMDAFIIAHPELSAKPGQPLAAAHARRTFAGLGGGLEFDAYVMDAGGALAVKRESGRGCAAVGSATEIKPLRSSPATAASAVTDRRSLAAHISALIEDDRGVRVAGQPDAVVQAALQRLDNATPCRVEHHLFSATPALADYGMFIAHGTGKQWSGQANRSATKLTDAEFSSVLSADVETSADMSPAERDECAQRILRQTLAPDLAHAEALRALWVMRRQAYIEVILSFALTHLSTGDKYRVPAAVLHARLDAETAALKAELAQLDKRVGKGQGAFSPEEHQRRKWLRTVVRKNTKKLQSRSAESNDAAGVVRVLKLLFLRMKVNAVRYANAVDALFNTRSAQALLNDDFTLRRMAPSALLPCKAAPSPLVAEASAPQAPLPRQEERRLRAEARAACSTISLVGARKPHSLVLAGLRSTAAQHQSTALTTTAFTTSTSVGMIDGQPVHIDTSHIMGLRPDISVYTAMLCAMRLPVPLRVLATYEGKQVAQSLLMERTFEEVERTRLADATSFHSRFAYMNSRVAREACSQMFRDLLDASLGGNFGMPAFPSLWPPQQLFLARPEFQHLRSPTATKVSHATLADAILCTSRSAALHDRVGVLSTTYTHNTLKFRYTVPAAHVEMLLADTQALYQEVLDAHYAVRVHVEGQQPERSGAVLSASSPTPTAALDILARRYLPAHARTQTYGLVKVPVHPVADPLADHLTRVTAPPSQYYLRDDGADAVTPTRQESAPTLLGYRLYAHIRADEPFAANPVFPLANGTHADLCALAALGEALLSSLTAEPAARAALPAPPHTAAASTLDGLGLHGSTMETRESNVSQGENAYLQHLSRLASTTAATDEQATAAAVRAQREERAARQRALDVLFPISQPEAAVSDISADSSANAIEKFATGAVRPHLLPQEPTLYMYMAGISSPMFASQALQAFLHVQKQLVPEPVEPPPPSPLLRYDPATRVLTVAPQIAPRALALPSQPCMLTAALGAAPARVTSTDARWAGMGMDVPVLGFHFGISPSPALLFAAMGAARHTKEVELGLSLYLNYLYALHTQAVASSPASFSALSNTLALNSGNARYFRVPVPHDVQVARLFFSRASTLPLWGESIEAPETADTVDGPAAESWSICDRTGVVQSLDFADAHPERARVTPLDMRVMSANLAGNVAASARVAPLAARYTSKRVHIEKGKAVTTTVDVSMPHDGRVLDATPDVAANATLMAECSIGSPTQMLQMLADLIANAGDTVNMFALLQSTAALESAALKHVHQRALVLAKNKAMQARSRAPPHHFLHRESLQPHIDKEVDVLVARFLAVSRKRMVTSSLLESCLSLVQSHALTLEQQMVDLPTSAPGLRTSHAALVRSAAEVYKVGIQRGILPFWTFPSRFHGYHSVNRGALVLELHGMRSYSALTGVRFAVEFLYHAYCRARVRLLAEVFLPSACAEASLPPLPISPLMSTGFTCGTATKPPTLRKAIREELYRQVKTTTTNDSAPTEEAADVLPMPSGAHGRRKGSGAVLRPRYGKHELASVSTPSSPSRADKHWSAATDADQQPPDTLAPSASTPLAARADATTIAANAGLCLDADSVDVAVAGACSVAEDMELLRKAMEYFSLTPARLAECPLYAKAAVPPTPSFSRVCAPLYATPDIAMASALTRGIAINTGKGDAAFPSVNRQMVPLLLAEYSDVALPIERMQNNQGILYTSGENMLKWVKERFAIDFPLLAKLPFNADQPLSMLSQEPVSKRSLARVCDTPETAHVMTHILLRTHAALLHGWANEYTTPCHPKQSFMNDPTFYAPMGERTAASFEAYVLGEEEAQVLRSKVRSYHSPLLGVGPVISREDVDTALLEQQQRGTYAAAGLRLADRLKQMAAAAEDSMAATHSSDEAAFAASLRNAIEEGDEAELEEEG